MESIPNTTVPQAGCKACGTATKEVIKVNVKISNIQKAMSPNPFALVTSEKEDGATNVMALSWWCYASNNPPTILICTSNKGYTGTCIRRTGEFSLCFPSEALKEVSMRCGSCSGRSVDKVTELGLEMESSTVIRPKLVRGCRAALECRLQASWPVGDHTVYVGEVVETHLDESLPALYAFNGYAQLDTVK